LATGNFTTFFAEILDSLAPGWVPAHPRLAVHTAQSPDSRQDGLIDCREHSPANVRYRVSLGREYSLVRIPINAAAMHPFI
jgi:hypothetical protein